MTPVPNRIFTNRFSNTKTLTKRTYSFALLAVLGAIALAVAGCGGGSSSTSESSNASSKENASSESSSGYGGRYGGGNEESEDKTASSEAPAGAESGAAVYQTNHGGAQDLTGYDVPAELATARHGGRTDVSTERPGLVALYQAPVAPTTRAPAPFGAPVSTCPLASGTRRGMPTLRTAAAT